MKTKQIYYQEPYKKDLQSKILSVEKKPNLSNIILEKTIFFPEGGGQPSDKGTLGNAKVEYVRFINGEIIHQVKGEVKVGDVVNCALDWNWRYRYMRIHTAGHLLHDVLMTIIESLIPTKGSHGKKAFLEYSGSLDTSKKEEIEKKANEILQQDLTVLTQETNYDELAKECKFLPPHLPKDKPLRMIRIGNYSPMPDGGVHVRTTKEIGKIWIANIVSQNNTTTIRYGITD